MGKGPTVFVRHRPGYISREKGEQIVRHSRNADELIKHMGKKAAQSYLEQDYTKGPGKGDRDAMKRNFRKFPSEIIRKAAEGRD